MVLSRAATVTGVSFERSTALQRVERWFPLLIVGVALALRLVWLEIKPPHFDEGVNGWFVDQMTRQGYYHYDPGNFHGPLHFYVLFVAQTLLGREIWVLRLPIVLVSTACVALVLAFRCYLPKRVCEIAALAMALSPGMIFFGRYAIHETWQVFFLLLLTWGGIGLVRGGTRRHLWAAGLGATGMVLTKETYAIHLIALALAFPALWILERISPSVPSPETGARRWSRRDLEVCAAVCVALIIFFYTGGFLDWSSLPGMWETFGTWVHTGTGGETGHEKPWYYWLDLMARYEWPAAAGLVASLFVVVPRVDRAIRYLAIAGCGTLVAYSIVSYKTPWCLISLMWPFYFVLGAALARLHARVDRWITAVAALVIFGASTVTALRLNFRHFTDETEPYVYVQTLPDIYRLMHPLMALAQRDPANFHLRGNILITESDSHPLPWMLADFPRVTYLDETQAPAEIDAPFLLVEDAIVSDIEERLKESYFRQPFILRGSWGQSATLYLNAKTFASFFPGRSPDFPPQEERAAPSEVDPDLGMPLNGL